MKFSKDYQKMWSLATEMQSKLDKKASDPANSDELAEAIGLDKYPIFDLVMKINAHGFQGQDFKHYYEIWLEYAMRSLFNKSWRNNKWVKFN